MNFKIVLLLLTFIAASCAVGQFYVPRAYFTIDGTGHESAHVPLRRLRRSADSTNPNSARAINNAHGTTHETAREPLSRVRRSASSAKNLKLW